MSDKCYLYKENEELQRFSGGIAHDLNNIIMVIDGFSECLKKTRGLTEKQIRYIDQIKKATVQIDDLTNILITICERSIVNMSYFNLEELIEVFIKEKISSEGFIHEINLQSETLETNINFDRSSIMTVLENLYQNSVYPEEKSRIISYKIARKSISEGEQMEGIPPGVYIILDIFDDGPGIEEKDIPDIFSPYFSTKPRGRGKGLGLTVCAGIVHQCGAYIEAVRPIGKGCRFRIYFPDNSRHSAGDPDDTNGLSKIENIRFLQKPIKPSMLIKEIEQITNEGVV